VIKNKVTEYIERNWDLCIKENKEDEGTLIALPYPYTVEGIIAKSFIPGTSATFEVVGERLPMDATAGNYALANHIDMVAQKYGFAPISPQKRSSGSDASYTTMAGVPSVCSMGPIGGRYHSTDEFMIADSLISRTKLLAAIVVELPDDFGRAPADCEKLTCEMKPNYEEE